MGSLTPAVTGAAPDIALLERWLSGWCLARGVALPYRQGGGLAVEVGWPDQKRRHVFTDAGAALQDCAARIGEPFVFLKACVAPEVLRAALPARWQIEQPRFLMAHPGTPALDTMLPAGYRLASQSEHGATVLRLITADGDLAASGRVVCHQGCAVYDRIETVDAHRRRGLASSLMALLAQVAATAGCGEHLLVATEAGQTLYSKLGWRVLAPYSTATILR